MRAAVNRLVAGFESGPGAKQNQVLTSFYISPRKLNFRLGAALGVAPLVYSVYRCCVDVTPLRFGCCLLRAAAKSSPKTRTAPRASD